MSSGTEYRVRKQQVHKMLLFILDKFRNQFGYSTLRANGDTILYLFETVFPRFDWHIASNRRTAVISLMKTITSNEDHDEWAMLVEPHSQRLWNISKKDAGGADVPKMIKKTDIPAHILNTWKMELEKQEEQEVRGVVQDGQQNFAANCMQQSKRQRIHTVDTASSQPTTPREEECENEDNDEEDMTEAQVVKAMEQATPSMKAGQPFELCRRRWENWEIDSVSTELGDREVLSGSTVFVAWEDKWWYEAVVRDFTFIRENGEVNVQYEDASRESGVVVARLRLPLSTTADAPKPSPRFVRNQKTKIKRFQIRCMEKDSLRSTQ